MTKACRALLAFGALTISIGATRPDARRAHDVDLARRAVLRHEVLPLPRILALAGGYQTGDIIEVELKHRHDALRYDVHVLVPSGDVRELLIDARTGRLLDNRLRD